MRISFTGDLGFNGLETKLPWLREGETKSGNDWKEKYEILKKYQAFLKAQRERK